MVSGAKPGGTMRYVRTGNVAGVREHIRIHTLLLQLLEHIQGFLPLPVSVQRRHRGVVGHLSNLVSFGIRIAAADREQREQGLCSRQEACQPPIRNEHKS